MSKAKIPVSINDLEFDALIDEERTMEATVPEYAVETGFTVSDAIIIGAEVLTMTLFVTNTPVTWNSIHGNNPNRVEEVEKRLEEIFFTKEPVKVLTSGKTYTNMAIESISINKTLEIGYAREIPISFRKIQTTEAKITTIPDSYGKSGATGASGGSANTSEDENSSADGGTGDNGNGGDAGNEKGSILYGIANSLGLLQKWRRQQ